MTDALTLAADALEAGLVSRPRVWVPRHHQEAPTVPWDTWALIGGRGCGKTDGAANEVSRHVRGPACLTGSQPHRIGIVAPTLGDAVDACVTGPSGLKAHDPLARMVSGIGGTYVRWPGGSEAKLFGAFTPDDVERFRAGGNRCLVWLEEVAAWRMLERVLEQIDFGLRLGPHPRKIVSSTPKPRKAFRDLLAEDGTVRTYTAEGNIPTMDDNPDLPQAIKDKLRKRYGGTRIGRQELKGEMLDDIPGAYWSPDAIERNRLTPEMTLGRLLARVVVAVDPAATATDESDETGIGAAAKVIVPAHKVLRELEGMDVVHPQEPHAHYYVLEDVSGRYSPHEWATAAVGLFDRRRADKIIGETNNGGDMVGATIRNVRRDIAFRKVVASRGKAVRAEPIAELYEQDLVHHIGILPELEDQLTTYTGPDSIEHDDRLDWLVYALTELSTGGVAFVSGVVQHGRGSSNTKRRGQGGYVNPRGEETPPA